MSLEDKSRRLVTNLQTVMEAVARADAGDADLRARLSRGELHVLRVLGRKHQCVMGRLAASVCLSLSSATGLIDGLIEKGLVRRERSAEDRRVVEVVLTEKGRAQYEASLAGPVSVARGLLKELTPDEQEALVSLFGKIGERLAAEKDAA